MTGTPTDRERGGAVLRVALVQAASSLEPDDNRAALGRLAPAGVDLVVFPEAFARDFGDPGSDVSPYAEPVPGSFADEVGRVADRLGSTVVAGMFERSADPARPFNTLVVRGCAETAYRKIHLYDSFGFRESDRLQAGAVEPCVFDLDGWRIGLMTCYDLRFPELARGLVDRGAELIVVPSAWVAGPRKVGHWQTLVTARAVENTVYVAAVGQPAPRYCGHSMVVDPLGDVVAGTDGGSPDEPAVVVAEVDRATLVEARRTNPSLLNRRL